MIETVVADCEEGRECADEGEELSRCRGGESAGALWESAIFVCDALALACPWGRLSAVFSAGAGSIWHAAI